jgi:hypothetical protein
MQESLLARILAATIGSPPQKIGTSNFLACQYGVYGWRDNDQNVGSCI